MKSFKLVTIAVLSTVLCLQAQTNQQVNLYTIPNQNANFVRMPARVASQQIDGVFANPAGLTELEKGLHISINNQFLRQKSQLESDYPFLENGRTEYIGDVGSLIFPSIYAAWKRDRFTYSFGFSLIAGGGGAEYDDLPVNEIGISDIPVVLNELFLDDIDQGIINNTGVDPMYNDIAGYDYDFFSSGVGWSPGFQFNGSYRFNDYLSGALGVRWVTQYTESEGYIRDIQVDVPQHGGLMPPGDYLRFVGDEVGGINGLILNITAPLIDSLVVDREIDVRERGSGFTPIFSVNARPVDGLNIAVKYEHKTKIELTTEVLNGKDGGGEFVNDTVKRSDMPSLLALGAQYRIFPKFTGAVGARVLFNNKANWGGREKFVQKPYYELEFAGEYQLTDRSVLSGGYTFVNHTVSEEFQNDVDFALDAHTMAIGGAYDIFDDLRINAGFLYTWFVNEEINQINDFAQGAINDTQIPSTQYFDKNALIFALGIEMVIANGKKN